ncbi:spore germination protein [Paenibacillus rhizoplanae]
MVVSNLLEGRFALLIDGTPFSLIAPVNMFSMLQSPEDYYENIYMSIFLSAGSGISSMLCHSCSPPLT